MFLGLGGYNESFVICQEETDLALRAIRAGMQVVHYPDFIIRHNPSRTRRSLDRNNFLIIRNEILIGFASFPLLYLFFRCTWYPIRTWLEKFTSFHMCLKATMEAFSMAPRIKRNPLSYEKYRQWKKLPRPCYLQEGEEMGQNRFYRLANAQGGT
jgi:GT2 family glycosyltransferase